MEFRRLGDANGQSPTSVRVALAICPGLRWILVALKVPSGIGFMRLTSPEKPARLATLIIRVVDPVGGTGISVRLALSLKSGTVAGPGVTVALKKPVVRTPGPETSTSIS